MPACTDNPYGYGSGLDYVGQKADGTDSQPGIKLRTGLFQNSCKVMELTKNMSEQETVGTVSLFAHVNSCERQIEIHLPSQLLQSGFICNV